MSAFTVAELEYLTSQPLMRFASASASGRPDVAPVVFEIDGSDIVTAGFDITHTVRYKNINRTHESRLSLMILRRSIHGRHEVSKSLAQQLTMNPMDHRSSEFLPR